VPLGATPTGKKTVAAQTATAKKPAAGVGR